jgi:hypothetical protein
VSDKVDWVTKRSLCSLPNVFRELRIQVEEDVKIRNALRSDHSPYEFSVVANGDGFKFFWKPQMFTDQLGAEDLGRATC